MYACTSQLLQLLLLLPPTEAASTFMRHAVLEVSSLQGSMLCDVLCRSSRAAAALVACTWQALPVSAAMLPLHVCEQPATAPALLEHAF